MVAVKGGPKERGAKSKIWESGGHLDFEGVGDGAIVFHAALPEDLEPVAQGRALRRTEVAGEPLEVLADLWVRVEGRGRAGDEGC